jgi:hypothetical protein
MKALAWGTLDEVDFIFNTDVNSFSVTCRFEFPGSGLQAFVVQEVV